MHNATLRVGCLLSSNMPHNVLYWSVHSLGKDSQMKQQLDPGHIMQTETAFRSSADFRAWCSAVGFSRFEVIPLEGPTCAAVAYK